MTLPRQSLISLTDTPYYHCVSRCVRRAFLCGNDHYSGKSYEHRRGWLEYLLLRTANVFAIRLCAYAVMSNHYHVVLHVRPDLSNNWSDLEVVKRWHRLFKPTLFSQRFVDGEPLREVEWLALRSDIKKWRARLTDISWFMRIVNERLARQANAEDKCTGRFSATAPCVALPPASMQSWEGRFKSQALLDERALLSCMAYVDLNPIRATIARTPETSDHTSVKHRIDAIKNKQSPKRCLERFEGITLKSKGIPFKLEDYIDLVDWTGRIIRDDKHGAISSSLPPILERLSLDEEQWKILTTEFEQHFQNWVGSEHIVRQICDDKAYQRIPSTKPCRQLFS